MLRHIYIIAVLLFLVGCSASYKDFTHFEIPPDWKTDEIISESITKYSESIKGRKFFLDPGHGGEDRRSKGRLGLVCEADLNLKVALALRSYLQQAGAIVYMCREKDETVDLKQRSLMANNTDAEVFISIHHNAPGSKDGDYINYTSTYFHAKDTDYEYEPCQRDMARYVQRDLSFVMGNSGGLGSFDGTYSDYGIYPKAGFSVLRITEKPSILIECGFFTNNFEERRLAQDEFNQIQAWGIFRGISKYFKAGIPEIISLSDEKTPAISGDITLSYKLQDKSGINPKSVQVFFDSLEVSSHFDKTDNSLQIPLLQVKEGIHLLRIICANNNGNYAFPFKRKLVVAARLETKK